MQSLSGVLGHSLHSFCCQRGSKNNFCNQAHAKSGAMNFIFSENSRLLCLIGFFSVHIAYMFAIYEPRVSTWPVQGWEPNSCLRTSKRQERQEPGRWTSSSQIQEDLQSQTEWQHLAPLFMVFLLHFTRRTFVGKVMSLLLNMLSRLLVTFLPRSKRFLMSWLQSPSAVILEPQKIKSDTVSTVSPSISYEVMGPDAMIFIF